MTQADPLASIATTVELSDGLVLILAVGPDFSAPEGLELIRKRFPPERPTLWHRLDRDGSDLAGVIRASASPNPILLAHGLEYLDPSERASIESSLNLLRDPLRDLKAAIILWIPESDLEDFQRHCADLFHWRSLLVRLREQDVGADPELVLRRRYLARVLLQVRPPEREFQFDRTVNGGVPLETWARNTLRGILVGEPEAGKTTALRALARSWAQESTLRGSRWDLPLVVRGRDLFIPFSFSVLAKAQRDHGDFPILKWAQEGILVLMVDGLHQLDIPEMPVLTSTMEGLLKSYPRMQILATSRRDPTELPPVWRRARLEPPSYEQVKAFVGHLASADPRRWSSAKRELFLRDLGYLSMSSTAPTLLQSWIASGRLPARVADLLSDDIERRCHPPSTSTILTVREYISPEFIRKPLAFLALRDLEGDHRGLETEGLSEVLRGFRVEADDLRIFFHAGLLYLGEEDRISFSHLLLQQYLAAEQLAANGPQSAAQTLEQHRGDPAWQPLVGMTAAVLTKTNPGDARALLERFWPKDDLPTEVRMRQAARVLEAAAFARSRELKTDDWRVEARRLIDSHPEPEVEQARHALEQALQWLELSQELSD